eukprot:6163347-Lingulodinium_polyedra.AAC.1
MSWRPRLKVASAGASHGTAMPKPQYLDVPAAFSVVVGTVTVLILWRVRSMCAGFRAAID